MKTPNIFIFKGYKSGKLTVTGYAHKHPSKGTQYYYCLCDCGNNTIVIHERLVAIKPRYKTVSCGHCNLHIKHPLAYTSWLCMKSRCSNPNYPGYKYYGGRGITVAESWKYSFTEFLKDMGDPPVIFGQRLTLDRIENNKNYCKENCKWATPTEQIANQAHFQSITRMTEKGMK